MATQTSIMRLSRDYKAIQSSPIPFIQARPSPTNILNWSFIITGPPSTPYAKGQYYGTLVFPPNFPYAGPKIRVITPSGRFVPNHDICTTFTSLHPEEWNPAWTVETILTGFLSFMTTNSEHGAGCICPGNEADRLQKAKESKRWNSLECSAFRRDFSEVHSDNLESEKFSEEDWKRLVGYERKRQKLEELENGVEDESSVGKDKLLDASYESHINEDWEKFGSMDEDFDYYDGEEEEDYETSETEMDCEEKEE